MAPMAPGGNDMLAQAMQQMAQNPERMQQFMNSPMMQQLTQALEDPDVQQTMRMMANPSFLRDMTPAAPPVAPAAAAGPAPAAPAPQANPMVAMMHHMSQQRPELRPMVDMMEQMLQHMPQPPPNVQSAQQPAPGAQQAVAMMQQMMQQMMSNPMVQQLVEQRPEAREMVDMLQRTPANAWNEQSFQHLMQQMMTLLQSADPPAPPATSDPILRRLPTIRVTQHDIEKSESAACVICQEAFAVGESATRLPCDHLFHEDCVKKWLRQSNQCPVCRYELPTDDAAYEQGRRARMADRRPRLRREDLSVKTVQELRSLADYFGVDTKGCLEKYECVERLVASGKIDIIDDDGAGASSSPTVGASGAGLPLLSVAPHQAVNPSERQAGIRRHGIDERCSLDKSELISRLVLLGPDTDAQRQALAEYLATWSVGELRKLAKRLIVNLDGCLEKADVVQRIRQSPRFGECCE